MQDEGGAKGLNPVLEKHWEKFVLGVVIAAGIIYFGTQFSGSGNTAAKGVDTAIAFFKKKKEEPNPRSEAPKTWVAPATIAPASADTPKDFTIGNKTIHTPIFKPTKPTQVSFWLPDLTLNAPNAGADGVILSWKLTNEKPDEKLKPPPTVLKPDTFRYKIERRKKGEDDSAWQPLVDKGLKTNDPRYLDTRTTPKTEYEYKVTLGSNDTSWEGKNGGMFSTRPQQIGGPVAIQTPGIWKFSFSNIQSFPDSDVAKPGQVYVTITKFDRDAGSVVWKKIQYEGDALGVIKEGGVEVSKHRVQGKRGRVTVDFKSGGMLKKITSEKLVLYEYKQCKYKVDGQDLVCDGIETVKASYKVNEIIYSDEDGKEQAHVQDAGPGKIADHLCEKHGGAPPPKELSPQEKAAGREEAAGKMLDDADRLWDSAKVSDRTEAQKMYKKLLDSYGDTSGVKARTNDLKERSRKKLD